MEWIEHVLRDNPSLAVFLTLGIGFFIGQLKYKSFSLGTVTSVLLVGVVIGQFDIPVPGPLKDVFFLLFLFWCSQPYFSLFKISLFYYAVFFEKS